MINKPHNLTQVQLSLVRETIRIVLQDKVITDKEWTYLSRLYWLVFQTGASKEIMISDLIELGKWEIKNVSK